MKLRFILLVTILALFSCEGQIEVQGSAAGGSAFLSFSASSINSGSKKVNTETSTSITVSVKALVTNLSISSSNNSWEIQSSNCVSTQGSGSTCGFTLVFSPKDIGSVSGTLTASFTNDGTNYTTTASLGGAGILGDNFTVVKAYPAEGEWGDYIQNSDSGKDKYHQTGTACTGAETGKDYCVHSGALLKVNLASVDSCDGLTATDSLGVFNWVCVTETGGGLSFYSESLKDGKGLQHLASGLAWRNNSVSIFNADNDKLIGSLGAKWWSDTQFVAMPTASGALDTESKIYVLSADRTDTGHEITANKVSVLVESGATLSAATPTVSNIHSNGENFLWVEGNFAHDESAGSRVIYLRNSKYSQVKNVKADGSDSYNLHLRAFDFGYVENVSTSDSSQLSVSQIYLQDSDYNEIKNFNSVNSGDWAGTNNNSTYNRYINYDARGYQYSGLRFAGGSNYNHAENLTFRDATSFWGLFFDGGDYNTFKNITAINVRAGVAFENGALRNRGENVYVHGTDRVVYYNNSDFNVVKNLFGTNSNDFVEFNEAENNVLINGLAVNNDSRAIHLRGTGTGSDRNTIVNVVIVNNQDEAMQMDNGSYNNTFANILSYSSSDTDVRADDSINNTFYGVFMVGASALNDCIVTGITNVLTDVTCSASGANGSTLNNATFYSNLDLSTSFVGAVTSDTTNTVDVLGKAAYASISSTEYLNVENAYRTWGKDGTLAFPNPAHQGECTSGTCQIWDWNINKTVGNVLYDKSGDGVNTNEAFVNGENCPDAIDGNKTVTDQMRVPHYAGINAIEDNIDAVGNDDSVCEAGENCLNVFLLNATEILQDSKGDDDGLCESNEDCIYSPNFGHYQGTGDYTTNTCTFQDGSVVTGVTMYAYPTN